VLASASRTGVNRVRQTPHVAFCGECDARLCDSRRDLGATVAASVAPAEAAIPQLVRARAFDCRSVALSPVRAGRQEEVSLHWAGVSGDAAGRVGQRRQRSAYKVLALQVELCSPRLIASRVDARWCLRAFGRGSGRRATTPLSRLPPPVLPDPVRLGLLVEPEPLADLRHEA